MEFKAELNLKFYIVLILLLAITVFGWYGLFFLNTNEILMEDNVPMGNQIKMFFSGIIGLVVLSWTISLFVLLRQMFIGYAFSIDEEGINLTATAVNILAFIFVVPIRKIPFTAIKRVSLENGKLVIHIDKSKIDINPIFRIFARKKYHFFSGFTIKKQESILLELSRYISF